MKMIAQAYEEPFTITPDGAKRRILSYGGKMMLVQFEFEAGTTSAVHSHPHEQIGYVVSGEIDCYLEGSQPVRLKAGGSYFVPSNARHYIRSISPTLVVDAFSPIREDFLA